MIRGRRVYFNQRAYGTPLERLERSQRMRAAIQRAASEKQQADEQKWEHEREGSDRVDGTASQMRAAGEGSRSGARERDGSKFERSAEFCARVGIYSHKLRELVLRYSTRGGPPIQLDERGESKRIVALISNPQFDTFCRSMTKEPATRS